MNRFFTFLLLASTGSSFAQTSTFTVTYDGIPACNTLFTVENAKGKEIGSGKSDMWGKFSCQCRLDNDEDFTLNAEPDKGKKWSLDIPMEMIDHFGTNYTIKIEKIEELVSGAFDDQKNIMKGAEDMNSDMNRQTGESDTGVKEIQLIKGIAKTAEVVGESQFKIIKVSIGRSCIGTNEKGSEGGEGVEATQQSVGATAESEKSESVTSEKQEVKSAPELSKKEQKALEEEEAAKAKEAKKEAERLEKERKEAERLEQERIEAEEEAAAEDLNFTPEEFGQMSNFDLNKKRTYCTTAADRNRMKLKMRSALLKEDEKKALEARIVELENAAVTIDAELARRKTEEDAKKAAKESEKSEEK